MPLPRSIAEPPSTVHRADLFFSAEPSSSRSQSSYHRHMSFSAVAPPPIHNSPSLSRSRTAPAPVPPPVPPPPPPFLSLPRHPPNLPSLPEPRVPSTPRSPIQHDNDEAELAAVLQISRTESEDRTLRLEELSTQEEEDLARALEESLRTARPLDPVPWSSTSHGHHFNIPNSSSSTASGSISSASLPVPPSPSVRSLPVPQEFSSPRPLSVVTSRTSYSAATTPTFHHDEALARQLAELEEQASRTDQQNGPSPVSLLYLSPLTLAILTFTQTLESDEALARRLAAEENEEMKDDSPTNAPLSALPPTYDDAVSPRPTPRPQSSDTSSLSVKSVSLTTPSSVSLSSTGKSIDSTISMPSMPFVPVRSTQSDTDILTKSKDYLDASSPPSPSSASLPGKVEASASSTPETPPINPNQFLDAELLRGVCKSPCFTVWI